MWQLFIKLLLSYQHRKFLLFFHVTSRSFIKRHASGTSSDNEWQRVTTSDNEWYNEWQRVYNEWQRVYNEWQRVVQRVATSGTTSDNEWYNEWQRMTTSGIERYNKWQSVTTSDSKWQWVTALTAVVQRMKTAKYTSNNGWLPSFQWQKQIHYYVKGWMAAIRVVR